MGKSSFKGLILFLAIIIGILIIFSGCIGEQQPIATPTLPPTPTPTSTPIVTTPTPPTPPTPLPKITISSPKEGDRISLRYIVEGTSTGVYGSGLSIYVLVYPVESAQWWVQPEVDILSDGNWETNAYFGDPVNPTKDIGKKFKISAIITSVKLKEGMQFGKVPDNVYRVEIKEVVRI